MIPLSADTNAKSKFNLQRMTRSENATYIPTKAAACVPSCVFAGLLGQLAEWVGWNPS